MKTHKQTNNVIDSRQRGLGTHSPNLYAQYLGTEETLGTETFHTRWKFNPPFETKENLFDYGQNESELILDNLS